MRAQLPHARSSSAFGRRSLLLGAGGLALVLTGCGSDEAQAGGGQTSASTPTGFVYTDARGKKIDLPAAPQVVVAQSSAAAALWDAGFKVKGAYGELAVTDGKLNYQAGNLVLDELTVIGEAYGEFNVEKYAAMGPELLIDLSFDPTSLWYVTEDLAKKIDPIAPSVGMPMLNKNLLEIIDEFMAMAAALGADTASAAIAEAKTAFEGAVAKVEAAVAAKPELRVLAVSRNTDKAYIANAAQHPDLAYLETLGVRFVDHRGKPEDYFSEISNEKLDAYSGDLVFDDSRSPKDQAASDAVPTWTALPAVKAGQVFDWKPAAPYSYASNIAIFEAFAEALTSSEQVA